MEFNNNLEESSKSSSEETDRSSRSEQIIDHDGRIYECVFCKRGFTTAQALGGHMNIHRKDRANNNNKAKPNFIIPPSKVIDDEDEYNYSDLGYYSSIPSHLAIGRGSHHYYSTIVHHHHQHEVDTNNNNNNNNNNYHSIYYFPPQASSYGTTLPSSHQVHYNNSEVLCEENYQRDYWRQRGNLSLYTNNLLCVHEKENNDKILKDKSDEEDGLDLELRLGHHHP